MRYWQKYWQQTEEECLLIKTELRGFNTEMKYALQRTIIETIFIKKSSSQIITFK